jgi:hypothetical protein
MFWLNWQKFAVFQRNFITPLEVFEFDKAKIGKLRAPYLGQIAQFSSKVKTIFASIGTEVNNKAVLPFCRASM